MNLQYYSGILLQTESLIIKLIYDKIDKIKLIYHSVYILYIITEEDWETHSYTSKGLFHYDVVVYRYFDYIDA